jgi:SH3 domain protein
MRSLCRSFAVITALAVPSIAQAETRWVTDKLEVPIRSGESNEYRILRFLDSGSEIDGRSRNAASGYSLIRDGQGREGYILSRYLESEPTASKRLVEVQTQLTQVLNDAQNGSKRIADLRESLESVTAERNAAQQELASVSAELSELTRVSSNVIAINSANTDLRERVQQLEDESSLLQSENLTLRDDKDKTFMLLGAGLVFAGILLGLLLPSLRRKRQSSNWF